MVKKHRHEDIVVTYSLPVIAKTPRFLPRGYKGKFIKLTQACINYYINQKLYEKLKTEVEKLEKAHAKGTKKVDTIETAFDLPYITHLSGLERVVNRKKRKKRINELNYYLIKDYSIYEDWKTGLKKNMEKVDKILKRRNNLLKVFNTEKFYHDITVECYARGFKVDSLTVSVKNGAVLASLDTDLLKETKKSLWVPDIEVSAKSITGQKKACENAVKDISNLVKDLFGNYVRNKHYELEIY